MAVCLSALCWANGQSSPMSAAGYVPSSTLTPESVSSLQLAWAHDLGFEGRIAGAPLFDTDTLFVSTDTGVIALDAVSGIERWAYQDGATAAYSGSLQRAPRGAPIIQGDTVIASLATRPAVVALDKHTGEVRWLRELPSDYGDTYLSSNPTLAGDHVVIGPTGADLSPIPGQLLALRISDGTIAWTFDLVPLQPEDPALSSWGPFAPSLSYGVGGGTAWNIGAYDPENDLVLFGTGQPAPADRLDPRRYEEDDVTPDLYTASFVAIHASTGALAWFHQVVPGDEWEYDQHTVPIVTDMVIQDEVRRVAILATTTGFLLIVDVQTGDLLQNHMIVPFSTVHVGYEGSEPVINDELRRTSSEESVRVCPGARWASVAPAAYHPDLRLVFRPNEWSCVRRGATPTPESWVPGSRALWLQADARNEEDFFDRWGALSAIDPLTGNVAWEFMTPYRHDSGVLTTSTGMVISAFADRSLRAFDARTGSVLWSYILPAHSDGTPILYEVDGIEHLAILVGRDIGVPATPQSGLPPSVAGPASLFVFRLP